MWITLNQYYKHVKKNTNTWVPGFKNVQRIFVPHGSFSCLIACVCVSNLNKAHAIRRSSAHKHTQTPTHTLSNCLAFIWMCAHLQTKPFQRKAIACRAERQTAAGAEKCINDACVVIFFCSLSRQSSPHHQHQPVEEGMRIPSLRNVGQHACSVYLVLWRCVYLLCIQAKNMHDVDALVSCTAAQIHRTCQ